MLRFLKIYECLKELGMNAKISFNVKIINFKW